MRMLASCTSSMAWVPSESRRAAGLYMVAAGLPAVGPESAPPMTPGACMEPAMAGLEMTRLTRTEAAVRMGAPSWCLP